MTTLLDYKTTLKYLGYLGYEGDTRKALTKTKRTKADSKKSHRNVFSCYVFGAPGTGKVIYI
jgi:Ras family protein T1